MFLSPITVDARTPLSYIAEFKINYTQQDVPAASLKYSVEEWKRWRLNCKPRIQIRFPHTLFQCWTLPIVKSRRKGKRKELSLRVLPESTKNVYLFAKISNCLGEKHVQSTYARTMHCCIGLFYQRECTQKWFLGCNIIGPTFVEVQSTCAERTAVWGDFMESSTIIWNVGPGNTTSGNCRWASFHV